jgi:putative endonuclease
MPPAVYGKGKINCCHQGIYNGDNRDKGKNIRITVKHIQKGKKNENLAACFLQGKGYRIIDRNWRYGKKEIDIIAEKDDCLVIAEVKSGQAAARIRPEEAVSARKQQMIIEAAEAFVLQKGLDREVRFDVIFVVSGHRAVWIEHIPDAFYPV